MSDSFRVQETENKFTSGRRNIYVKHFSFSADDEKGLSACMAEAKTMDAVLVYLWPPSSKDRADGSGKRVMNVGHASIGIPASRKHLSWWPSDDNRTYRMWTANIAFSCPAVQGQTFAADQKAEGGVPQHVYMITGLDTAAMLKSWTTQFNKDYDLFDNNCSTVAIRLLEAGGFPETTEEPSLYWEPMDIMEHICKTASLAPVQDFHGAKYSTYKKKMSDGKKIG